MTMIDHRVLTTLLSLTAYVYVCDVHSFATISSSSRPTKPSSRFLAPGKFIPSSINNEDDSNCDINRKLVVGINKYSHDTSICAADANTGEVLFFLSKERLSRHKHDGGPSGTLVEEMLHTLHLDVSDIEKVVVNNHHHRILPLEKSFDDLMWQVSLGVNYDDDVLDELNLLSEVKNKHEMSHHLAHAYSAAAQAPFEEGLVVIMDGMGESFGVMAAALNENETTYSSDLLQEEKFVNIPSDIRQRNGLSNHGWREGESAYKFAKNIEGGGICVEPIFKRWIEERTPPALYNHGFENMQSIGAVYSRASSHIFRNWNACGKVMGLAPWYNKWADEEKLTNIMSGKIYSNGTNEALSVNIKALSGKPLINTCFDFDDETEPDEDTRAAIVLAQSVQRDLEFTALDFISWLKEESKATNICFAGGVALNSVLNGKIQRDLGFDKVFIPPYPGDDGISVGCCAYGLFGNTATPDITSSTAPVWSGPLSPYLGPVYDLDDIEEAIEHASPWIEVNEIVNDDVRLDTLANEIASGGVVALFHGRSEAGPRALGHRSILADPRKGQLEKFINNAVKSRESFRPFAPSVLAERANDWFVNVADNASPYMSITTQVRPEKLGEIPAVTHVDGSSRLQTVRKDDEPLYYNLISKFYEITGVPLVLNTSFNTLKGEPIVETPYEAIRSFLQSMKSIETLAMGPFLISRKDPDPAELFEIERSDGTIVMRKLPHRAGSFMFEQKGSVQMGVERDDDLLSRTTRVRMPDRILHDDTKDCGWVELDELDVEILGICDGENGVQEIIEAMVDEDGNAVSDDETIQAILDSLVKLFDFAFISW